jgi:hypothetical protein
MTMLELNVPLGQVNANQPLGGFTGQSELKIKNR